MRFFDLLAIVTALLRQRRRVSYHALKREFELDDACLEDLRFELVEVERSALDQDGKILVWAGEGMPAAERDPARAPDRSNTPLPLIATSSAASRGAAREVVQPPPAVAASDAERRPLTVMFCDLADSTALSRQLDPEDLQDVIRAYHERCTVIVQEYDGFVAKYMGDGILVYFGYPKSLERNAERAVRSGLAIVAAMAGLNAELRARGIEVAVRIGIATGLVMVGEIVGEGLAQERSVIGEAPNVAARLQGLAGRNGIVVGALTREVAGDAFTYQEFGAHELKALLGWSRPGA